jgi:hypothetical protein
LIALKKWKICEIDSKNQAKYSFAILQEEARSTFNKIQYEKCMLDLTGLKSCAPKGGGTFVAHHMAFHTECVKELLDLMVTHTGSNKLWPLVIMSFSKKYFRFSEYMTYATFMAHYHPDKLSYHEFNMFGKGGVRFRDTHLALSAMINSLPIVNHGFSFEQVNSFFLTKNGKVNAYGDLTYVQLEHVYGLIAER